MIESVSDQLIKAHAEIIKLKESLDGLWETVADRCEEVADRAAENHHPYTGPSMPSEVFILRNLAEEFRGNKK